MKIKHNKIKNTGLIFELLTRTLINDTLENKKSFVPQIIKKYFKNTELSKEYKLYEFLIKNKNLNESKAQSVLNTVTYNVNSLNNNKLKKEKYNLINEIRKHYDINEFFKTLTPDYKLLASIYLLFEIERKSNKINLLEESVKYKNVIIENLTLNTQKIPSENKFIAEYNKQDNLTKSITQKLLIEKCNESFKTLSENQKITLKEYIKNSDKPDLLLEYYNKRVYDITKYIVKNINLIDSEPIKIKLKESLNYLKPLVKSRSITDEKIINLLHFDELIDNLKTTI